MPKNSQYTSLINQSKGFFSVFISFILIILVLLALAIGAWYLLAPQSMASVYGRWLNKPLIVTALNIQVSNTEKQLKPGEVLTLNPKQLFYISSLKTSRWLNYDLRLYSPDFDVEEFRNEGQKKTLFEVLGEKSFHENAVFEIQLKEGLNNIAIFKINAVFEARDLLQFGDLEKEPKTKINYYKQAFLKDSNSAVIKEKLYRALLDNNELAEAALVLEAELLKNENIDDLLSLYGLYKELENITKQISVLERLIVLRSQDKQSVIGYETELAALYNKNNNYVKAAEIYEKLLKEANAKQAVIYLNELLKIYRLTGLVEAEIKIWEKLIAYSEENKKSVIWAEIIKLYEKTENESGQRLGWHSLAEILPSGKEKANAYKKLGFLWAKAEKYSEAVLAYNLALEYDDKDVVVYHNLAKIALLVKDKDDYIKQMEKVLSLEATNLAYRLEYAENLFKNENFTKAKKEYENILKLDSNNKMARVRLISLLEKSDDRQKLIQEYEKLLENNKDDKISYYNLAVLFFKDKSWEKSKEYFQKTIELDSNDIDAHNYLMVIYKELNNEAQMLEEAKILIKLQPNNKEYLDLLLSYYGKDSNLDALINLMDELVEGSPENENFWLILAEGYKKKGQKTEYANSLLKIAKLKNNNLSAWFEAAQAYEKDNKYEEALKIYEKILELEPNNAVAEKRILELSVKELSKNKM